MKLLLLFALLLSGCTDNGRYQTTPIGRSSYLVTDTQSGAVYVGDYSPDRRSDTLILFSKPVKKR